MIRMAMSARDRRTLFAGSAAVGLLLALSEGMPRLRGWEAGQRSAALNAATQLAVARAGVRHLPALRDSLQARTARLASLDSSLVDAAAIPDAAAMLASLIDEAAGSAGVRVSSLQIRPDTQAIRSLVRVAVRVNGTTDVVGLAAFLRAIDGGDELISIRELNVAQPEPNAPEFKPEALRIEALVEAIARIRPPARGRS